MAEIITTRKNSVSAGHRAEGDEDSFIVAAEHHAAEEVAEISAQSASMPREEEMMDTSTPTGTSSQRSSPSMTKDRVGPTEAVFVFGKSGPASRKRIAATRSKQLPRIKSMEVVVKPLPPSILGRSSRSTAPRPPVESMDLTGDKDEEEEGLKTTTGNKVPLVAPKKDGRGRPVTTGDYHRLLAKREAVKRARLESEDSELERSVQEYIDDVGINVETDFEDEDKVKVSLTQPDFSFLEGRPRLRLSPMP